MDKYLYLVGTTHYDPDEDDAGVFKCIKIVAEDSNDGHGFQASVYRSKYDAKTQKWGKVNMDDPIYADSVVLVHANKACVKRMNSILHKDTQQSKKRK